MDDKGRETVYELKQWHRIYEIIQKEEWLNEECAEINKKEKKTDVKSMYKRF